VPEYEALGEPAQIDNRFREVLRFFPLAARGGVLGRAGWRAKVRSCVKNTPGAMP
jgi:hypothetical protein